MPRSQEDFGGGGAYPEVHVAQFPLDMGRNPSRAAAGGTSTAIVPMAIDANTGQARFDAIITAQHRGKAAVHTQFSELVEKKAEEVVRLRPSAEEEAAAAAKTAAALNGIVSHALSHARTSQVDPNAKSRADEAKFIRYTPAEDAPGFSAATSQRIIKMVEAPVDPLEPPKFKHKKVPGGPPEAPVPVMHSPPRKVTAEDQAAWKIPPSISNWKNPHGYIVPLDKRLAADGRSLLEPVINDNFAKLSEALLIAERKARVEVETRAAIAKKLAVKEKEAKEAELRNLAAKARLERAGVATNLQGAAPSAAGTAEGAPAGFGDRDMLSSAAAAAAPSHRARGPVMNSERAALLEGEYYDNDAGDGECDRRASSSSSAAAAAAGGEEDYAAAKERDRLRAERKRERERELRQEASGKRAKSTRDEDRDVSERIALGMPVGSAGAGGAGAEAMYDSRLFNQAEGMQQGFGAEDGEWPSLRAKSTRASIDYLLRVYTVPASSTLQFYHRMPHLHLFSLQITPSTPRHGGRRAQPQAPQLPTALALDWVQAARSQQQMQTSSCGGCRIALSLEAAAGAKRTLRA